MSFDLATIRADFPSLSHGTAYFDSPGGTQTPRQVSEAIAAALNAPLSNRSLLTASSRNAEEIVVAARAALADLTAGSPSGVVFGRSSTQLTFDFSRMLAKEWAAGDEVIVTRLDHDANVRPWVIAAERVGAVVRFADFDPATGEMAPSVIGDLLSERTRLVAVTGASNLIGTMPDLAAISALVHAAGAELYVDGVHYTAHQLVDVAAIGADFFTCSPYKFFGPHLGCLVASPDRLADLQPDKLLPSTNDVPERFELGTLPYELLAGATAAVDYLADLGGTIGTRRERLALGHKLTQEAELALRSVLCDGLDNLGAIRYSRAERRTSTVLFDLPGRDAAEVAESLAAQGINAPAGNFYGLETSRHLGLGDRGAVRAGLAPYTSAEDVERLLAACR